MNFFMENKYILSVHIILYLRYRIKINFKLNSYIKNIIIIPVLFISYQLINLQFHMKCCFYCISKNRLKYPRYQYIHSYYVTYVAIA